ncbi:MAG TPA: YIP1 family protein [Actinomycetota bacterium]|nr:YIP1 family protein [Actinomycetota bacterium]
MTSASPPAGSAPSEPAGSRALQRDVARSSARLGHVLRSVATHPARGFRSAQALAGRRERSGRRPAEGLAPYLLAVAGGAAAALLWLKGAAVAGWRNVPQQDFHWGYLGGALLLGAVVALAAQIVWGVVGGRLLRALGGRASTRDLRMVWGMSAGPQVLSVLLLFPCDALLGGAALFTNGRFADPVAAGWGAVSAALAVLFQGWSLGLFVRGVEVVSGADLMKTAVAVAGAGACMAVIVAGVSAAVLWAGGAA